LPSKTAARARFIDRSGPKFGWIPCRRSHARPVPCCPPDNVDGVTSMMLNGPGASQINCAAASAVPRKCVELGRGCHVNRHGRHPPGVPSLGRSGCDQAEERSNYLLSPNFSSWFHPLRDGWFNPLRDGCGNVPKPSWGTVSCRSQPSLVGARPTTRCSILTARA
jgi:hypothetical protein